MLLVMAELRDNLKRLRAAAGMTQQELAVAAGLSVSIVAQLERGVIRDPRMETLRALASALRTTLDALAGHTAAGAGSLPSAQKQKRRRGRRAAE
jgi:transcriptional regulator with XRE-family HTH domain